MGIPGNTLDFWIESFTGLGLDSWTLGLKLKVLGQRRGCNKYPLKLSEIWNMKSEGGVVTKNYWNCLKCEIWRRVSNKYQLKLSEIWRSCNKHLLKLSEIWNLKSEGGCVTNTFWKCLTVRNLRMGSRNHYERNVRSGHEKHHRLEILDRALRDFSYFTCYLVPRY